MKTSLVYAENGTEFWVPIQYPSGIWRVQKLVAGENGKFIWSEHRGLWMHVGSYGLAYTERIDAVYDCRRLIQIEHNKSFHEMRKATRRHQNQTKFLMAHFEYCKETR